MNPFHQKAAVPLALAFRELMADQRTLSERQEFELLKLAIVAHALERVAGEVCELALAEAERRGILPPSWESPAIELILHPNLN